jgi:D-sedoheptulose 7-phosphate isomerase
MKDIINKEHKEFIRLLDSIQVTDNKGKGLPFDDGIESACGIIRDCLKAGGKLIAVGNGGSSAIASHMVLDAWKNGGMKSLCFNDPTLLTCISNDYGYDQVFAKPVEFFGKPADVLTAISSSGKSMNILNAVGSIREKKGMAITLSGFKPDNPLRSLGDVNFYVASGDYGIVEVIHQYICHLITDVLIRSQKK